MNALQISRAHFIGLSLGGMLGQYLGAHHSARFSSLTLANTTCEQVQPDAWKQRIEIAALRGVGPLVAGTLPRWFTPRVFVERQELVVVAEALARGTSVAGFIGCASVVRDLSQRDLLAAIDVPTLVIAGELDQATTVEEANVLVENIHGARLQTLDAAHQSAMECPDAFARAWTQFQREISLERGLA
jgi:3-oxoadipate enol-lactonase